MKAKPEWIIADPASPGDLGEDGMAGTFNGPAPDEHLGGWISYTEGEPTITLDGQFTPAMLRDLAHMIDANAPLAADESVTAPALETLRQHIVVKRPDAVMGLPEIGQFGGMSLGAYHIVGPGPVMAIALHHTDGTTLIGTFGHDGYCELAHAFNRWGARINAGEFDHPPVAS